MTSRLDIFAPATMTVLAGNATLSSLPNLPPGGISVADPVPGGTFSVQLSTVNVGAALSASNGSGAVAVRNGNRLTITGTAAQVNAALASLVVIEPATVTSDRLALTASGAGVLGAVTDVAISLAPTAGPAFVAPPATLHVAAGTLAPISGLLLSDPAVNGLIAMGKAGSETLALNMSVGSGVLVLPGFSDAGGINATGIGTGTISLTFPADDIAALNTLLAGLEYAGPAVKQPLDYVFRNASGVLPFAFTYGNIELIPSGTVASGSFAAGNEGVVFGTETLSGTRAIAGTLTILGDVGGSGAIFVAPQGSLQMPVDALVLSGTSLDDGAIAADGLDLSGTLLAGLGAQLAGPLSMGAGALVDFAGTLETGGAASALYALATSLAAGAEVTGNGTLMAGDFAGAGRMTGQGTLLAQAGETLTVQAGLIDGGLVLAAAGGGVLDLAAIAPLFGLFAATPMTLGSAVTLDFADDGGFGAVGGRYADLLGGEGGAIVVSGATAFAAALDNFVPGDALIFPNLATLSLTSGASGFTVAGADNYFGGTDQFTFFASLAAGATLSTGADAQGDAEILLLGAPSVTASIPLAASNGVAQPLAGLGLQLSGSTSGSLALTVSAANGLLSEGGLGSHATLTLAAAGIAGLDAALASLTYTGAGIADALTITSGAGPLAGLAETIGIAAIAAGTINGDTVTSFSAAQTASFGTGITLPVITAGGALGALLVTGTTDFADALLVQGLSGTALVVDDGASAVFDGAASVSLGANVTLGDLAGAGTMVVNTGNFSVSGNMTLGTAAGSALVLPGSLELSGALDVGVSAAAIIDIGGRLSAASTSLGGAGTIIAYGGAYAQFGVISNAGTIIAENNTRLEASSISLVGSIDLGGQTQLDVTGQLFMISGPHFNVGADASATLGSLFQVSGAVNVAGVLASSGVLLVNGPFTLAGGTIEAPTLSLASIAQFGGDGLLEANVAGPGTLTATGGLLDVGGTVASNVALDLAATGSIEIAGSLAGGTVAFLGADALLTVDRPQDFSASVLAFGAADAVDLVGVAPSLVSVSGNTIIGTVLDTISIHDSLGNLETSFTLSYGAGLAGLSVGADGFDGALLTQGGELPCFARGTRLLTPHGYRAVETLAPGDPLVTLSGARRPVRWIGWRTLDLAPAAARFARPVRILPGAFGLGQPARALRLSPLHCVFAEGVLVPVRHLVNGVTILHEAAAAMTYYHVELDRHDVLLAEGLPCESYFCSGNRAGLYHETGRRSPARRPFAPSVTAGARLAAIRRRLHEIVLTRGFQAAFWPRLRAVGEGREAPGVIDWQDGRRRARFAFPAPVRVLTLHSAAAAPAETDPESDDWRELGVCLANASGLRLLEGFYAPAQGDAGIWMGRMGRLELERPARELVLSLAAVAPGWIGPVIDGAPARA